MSDPREFERDPSQSGNRYLGRQSGGRDSSAWIISAVIVMILLGLAAYSYRESGTQVTTSGTPGTTSGQSNSGQSGRAPVPSTPPAAPVAPAEPRQ
jgi:hypothetical protein